MVWRQKGGKAVLLDGHTRLEICRKHNLRYTIVVVELDSREEAKRWIIENQLHRRNLSETQRALLAAQIANLPAHRPGDASAHSCAVTQSAAAAKHAVSRRTVQHATRVVRHGSPKLREASQRGVIPASVASVITKLPQEEQDRIAQQCLELGDAGPARTAASNVLPAQKRKRVATHTPGIDEGRQSTGDLNETVLAAFRSSLRIQMLTTAAMKVGRLTPESRKELADKCRRVAGRFIDAADYLEGNPKGGDMMAVVDA